MHRCTTALYFSPTGGTRTYVRAVAAAMPHMGGEVDLTRPEERRKVHMFGADDVVVLGVPVYYGRVPEVPGLLDGLQGEETPAVPPRMPTVSPDLMFRLTFFRHSLLGSLA